MPPKKGAGSSKKKKDKAAIEAARLAAEEAARIETQREVERIAEQKRLEEVAADERRVFIQKKRVQDASRIADEKRLDAVIDEEQYRSIQCVERERDEALDWRSILNCDTLPERPIKVPSQLSAFMTLWRDMPETSQVLLGRLPKTVDTVMDGSVQHLDTISTPPPPTINTTQSTIPEVISIAEDAQRLIGRLYRDEMTCVGNESARVWCVDQRVQLGKLVERKINMYTARRLVEADEQGAMNRTQIIDEHVSPQSLIQFALWTTGRAKLKRTKIIEIERLCISVDLPSTLTMQSKNGLALRVLYTAYDPMAALNRGSLRSVGGVWHLHAMDLPLPLSELQDWNIREINTAYDDIDLRQYPGQKSTTTTTTTSEHPPAEDSHNSPIESKTTTTTSSSSSMLPIKVSLRPSSSLVLPDPLCVAYWDDALQLWSCEGISDVRMDTLTRTVHLQTSVLAPITIVQPRVYDYPYQYWRWTPSHTVLDQGELTIIGHRFILRMAIHQNGHASLIAPQRLVDSLRLVSNGNSIGVDPCALIDTLCQLGVVLCPVDNDVDINSSLTSSFMDDTTLNRIYNEMGRVSSGIEMCSSAWNGHLHNSNKSSNGIVIRIRPVACEDESQLRRHEMQILKNQQKEKRINDMANERMNIWQMSQPIIESPPPQPSKGKKSSAMKKRAAEYAAQIELAKENVQKQEILIRDQCKREIELSMCKEEEESIKNWDDWLPLYCGVDHSLIAKYDANRCNSTMTNDEDTQRQKQEEWDENEPELFGQLSHSTIMRCVEERIKSNDDCNHVQCKLAQERIKSSSITFQNSVKRLFMRLEILNHSHGANDLIMEQQYHMNDASFSSNVTNQEQQQMENESAVDDKNNGQSVDITAALESVQQTTTNTITMESDGDGDNDGRVSNDMGNNSNNKRNDDKDLLQLKGDDKSFIDQVDALLKDDDDAVGERTMDDKIIFETDKLNIKGESDNNQYVKRIETMVE